MGHVITNGLDLIGTGRSVHLDSEFKSSIDNMVAIAAKSQISENEKKHVNAVALWAGGYV